MFLLTNYRLSQGGKIRFPSISTYFGERQEGLSMTLLIIRMECVPPQDLHVQIIKINYLQEVDPYLILPGFNIWNIFLLC